MQGLDPVRARATRVSVSVGSARERVINYCCVLFTIDVSSRCGKTFTRVVDVTQVGSRLKLPTRSAYSRAKLLGVVGPRDQGRIRKNQCVQRRLRSMGIAKLPCLVREALLSTSKQRLVIT